MSFFVLDNSVAMRWHLSTNKKKDQIYSEEVLKSLANAKALVPELWHLEAANVLLAAEKNAHSTVGEVERFISQLENLPIFVDTLTAKKALNRTIILARQYNLSSYDAAYLELAIRKCIPLATLDKNLIKAAKKSKVDLYLQ